MPRWRHPFTFLYPVVICCTRRTPSYRPSWGQLRRVFWPAGPRSAVPWPGWPPVAPWSAGPELLGFRPRRQQTRPAATARACSRRRNTDRESWGSWGRRPGSSHPCRRIWGRSVCRRPSFDCTRWPGGRWPRELRTCRRWYSPLSASGASGSREGRWWRPPAAPTRRPWRTLKYVTNEVHQKDIISRILWYSDWLHTNTISAENSIFVTNHNTTSGGRRCDLNRMRNDTGATRSGESYNVLAKARCVATGYATVRSWIDGIEGCANNGAVYSLEGFCRFPLYCMFLQTSSVSAYAPPRTAYKDRKKPMIGTDGRSQVVLII